MWDRFGNVKNYVEPFAGSLAVLLGRPHEPGIETVNDLDCYLANFWRAVKSDPVAVAGWTDWPVNEADLHARHKWLHGQVAFRERMKSDPDFFDAKIAGWWAWGICSWIGGGWCAIGAGMGLHRKRPHLGNAGMGLHRKLPHLGDAGMAQQLWLMDLAARLRRVRVACGEWDRVLGDSVTVKHGITGVFLDPPYSLEERDELYPVESGAVATDVREWAIANGDNPDLRIALCGYEGEHQMPDTWDVLAWKTKGGYGSQGEGRGRSNSSRERIWFSPHCIKTRLF